MDLTWSGEGQVEGRSTLFLRLGQHMMTGVIMTALCRHHASAVVHAKRSINMTVSGVKLAVPRFPDGSRIDCRVERLCGTFLPDALKLGFPRAHW